LGLRSSRTGRHGEGQASEAARRKKSLSHRRHDADAQAHRLRWSDARTRGRFATREGDESTSIDWIATLRAKRRAPLDARHLRYRRKRDDAASLHCFVLDCSGSMLSGERLARAKGMLVALFDRAYLERAEIALVCFGGARAEVRRQPGAAHWWNERWIAPIGGGGGTPLALGLASASNVLARAAQRRPAQRRWLWLLTDGRTNEQPPAPDGAHRVIVVDFDEGFARVGRCAEFARAWRAEHVAANALLEHA
jgi:magnesium chelatase subunit ChlD-like protein